MMIRAKITLSDGREIIRYSRSFTSLFVMLEREGITGQEQTRGVCDAANIVGIRAESIAPEQMRQGREGPIAPIISQYPG